MQRRDIPLAVGHWWAYCQQSDSFTIMRPDGSKTIWDFWIGILAAVPNGERSLWFDSFSEARAWARQHGCNPFNDPAASAE
jgi:hypothetical protein